MMQKRRRKKAKGMRVAVGIVEKLDIKPGSADGLEKWVRAAMGTRMGKIRDRWKRCGR